MRKIKSLAIVLLVVAALLLTACSASQAEQVDVIKAHCEDMVDAIIANDAESGYAIITNQTDKQQFMATFAQMHEYISQVNTYELTQKAWRSGSKNGTPYFEATFEMTTNAETYRVTAVTVDGYDGLYSFHIAALSDTEVSYTGTITTMSGASALQWGLILLSAVCIAFVVFTFIDCLRRKLRLKPLWLILIVCGAMILTFSSSGGLLRFHFNIGLLFAQYSHMKQYVNGAFTTQLVVPMGAIIYWILRKKYTLPTTSPDAQPIANPSLDYPSTQSDIPSADVPEESNPTNEI